MIDQNPLPPRQLRIVARVARWMLAVVAAFWLLLIAVGVVLHGFIVPRIGDWRPHVERLATRAVGAPVQIGAILAHSEGIFPTIELLQLSILDAQGTPALQLPRVVATISARSVLRLGLEQLYVDAPVLDIRHRADGQWQLAGLVLSAGSSQDSQALEWLLDQPELALQHGTIHFTDDMHGLQVQSFHEVNLVMRRRAWQHMLRLDAQPEGHQERIQAMGVLHQPLLPSSRPPWERWTGQWYAETRLQELPVLPLPEAWGVTSLQGAGGLRTWVDIDRGQLAGITTDLAIDKVQVAWQVPEANALSLRRLQGRLKLHAGGNQWHVQGQNVSFMLDQEQHWPSSNWSAQFSTERHQTMLTRLNWDYADLDMARTLAQSLPLPASVRDPLAALKPGGSLRDFHFQHDATHYTARGRFSDLHVQSQADGEHAGTPGFQGLSGVFDLNERGGQADLVLQTGSLTFPGVFEEPELPFDSLQAQVRWQIKDGLWQLQIPQAEFANPDAQGILSATWRMGDTPENRLPGILDLKGKLLRADGARVHRYLPLELPASARHYVRDSVRYAEAENVRFEVRGDLHHMPFSEPGTGRFYIEAPLRNVTYDFLPVSLRSPGQMSWPALHQMSGDLVFEGESMEVRHVRTSFTGHPQVHMASVHARIPQLSHPQLLISASGQGRLQPMLDLARQSPLAGFTSHALDEALSQGQANVAFDLDIPIEHTHPLQVRGHVGFQDSELQLFPHLPVVQKLQGTVHFSEQGFTLDGVQGHALGGQVALSGGMASPDQGVRVKARGHTTAEGLQSAHDLPLVAQLARFAQGQTGYEVEIASQHGRQAVLVRSDLRGMALNLPAPLDKSPEQVLPLSVAQTLFDENMQELRVDVGGRGSVSYLQDVSTTPARVISGHIAVGSKADMAPHTSDQGISASVQLPQLDVDAWLELLEQQDDLSTPSAEAQAYLPSRIELKVEELRLRQRHIQQVRAQVARAEGRWHGQLQAEEFGGYVEYLPPNTQYVSGRIFARLEHLSLPKAEAQRLNELPEPQSSPDNLPALDIQVDALSIAGKALGKLELQAHNRAGEQGREWVLEQFDLNTPEARWKANGVWGSKVAGQPRHTMLSFMLHMDNAGQLLTRFGMPGVIHHGEGMLTGHIDWEGAPVTPHWQSMEGGLHMEVGKGQFLKAEPGMGKLLSVLSLQSLSRRINLDFRDVFSQGFAFDFVRGDITVSQGVARTNNLQMKGLNAAVLMEGQANLEHETQSLRVVVVPEINAMTASLAATAINPVIGLGSFLAQMLLRAPLMEAATRTFHVQGSWSDPVVAPMQRNAPLVFPSDESPMP